MYQKFIQLNPTSYIEVTSRLNNGKEDVVLALRGTKGDNPAMVSIVLNCNETQALIQSLNEAMEKVS